MIETCPECGQPDNCGDCTHESVPEFLKVGDRIELVQMGLETDGRPDPDPIPPGATGTVTRVHKTLLGGGPMGLPDCHQINVAWDDERRSLSLVVPPDTYRIIERVMD